MSTTPIPPGYESPLPSLICRRAEEMIAFYKKAFGAEEIYKLTMPDGRIGHAELQIAGGRIALADEFPEWDCRSPIAFGGSGSAVMIYVEDVDALADRAIAAGAEVLMPVSDQFYGDRCCKLRDPSGHIWLFSSRVEDLSPEEIQRRAGEFPGGPDTAA